jgi:hypothetical protein
MHESIWRFKEIRAPATSTGVCALEEVPMPSWPSPALPQHLTPFPITIAHVWAQPAVIAMAETPGGLNQNIYIPAHRADYKTALSWPYVSTNPSLAASTILLQ